MAADPNLMELAFGRIIFDTRRGSRDLDNRGASFQADFPEPGNVFSTPRSKKPITVGSTPRPLADVDPSQSLAQRHLGR